MGREEMWVFAKLTGILALAVCVWASPVGGIPPGRGRVGLLMVLTDLGNSVTRVSDVRLVPLDGFPLLPSDGWEMLELPVTSRVEDAVSAAMRLLGSQRCACTLAGAARALTDFQTEHLVWDAAQA